MGAREHVCRHGHRRKGKETCPFKDHLGDTRAPNGPCSARGHPKPAFPAPATGHPLRIVDIPPTASPAQYPPVPHLPHPFIRYSPPLHTTAEGITGPSAQHLRLRRHRCHALFRNPYPHPQLPAHLQHHQGRQHTAALHVLNHLQYR